MHRHYCTYFDKNYLLKAVSLIASLNRHSTSDFTLYAVCLDDLTLSLLNRLALPNVVAVPLCVVEDNDAGLAAAKAGRSVVEYYWTLTPSVILWVLNRYPEIEIVTYLDADLYFFDDSQPIFDEWGDNSILIHEHRFPEMLKHLEAYGKYNVGLVSFRRDAFGLEALEWWRERCNEWCYSFIDNNRYGDQRYLDDWPDRFRKVHVLQNIGAAVAPWNHIRYSFRTEGERLWVDDRPVIFYHFHSLYYVRPEVVVPAKFVHYPLREDILVHCFLPYLEELTRSTQQVRKLAPGFSCGLIDDEVMCPDHTVLAQKGHEDWLRERGLAHPVLDLPGGWQCHCSCQMEPSASG